MGPKGIGPQRLGAGQAMSDCGCGMPKACDCDSPAKNASAGYGYDLKSPAKLAPLVGMVAKKVLVDKIAEKASPNKRKNCNY